MAEDVNVSIEKGLYPYAQPSGYLVLKEYILRGDGKERQLYLRFYNESSVRINAFSFIVSVTNSSGKASKRLKVHIGSVNIAPGSLYVAKRPIDVGGDCADFTISIISFVSDQYKYVLHNNQYNSYYMVRAEQKRSSYSRKESELVSAKRPGVKFSAVIATLALIAICVFTGFVLAGAESAPPAIGCVTESSDLEIHSTPLGESDVEI